jgi:hypothetical protein
MEIQQQASVLDILLIVYDNGFTLSAASSPAARRTAAPPLLLMLPGWHPFSCARVQTNPLPTLCCSIVKLYGFGIALNTDSSLQDRSTSTTSTQHRFAVLKRDESNMWQRLCGVSADVQS